MLRSSLYVYTYIHIHIYIYIYIYMWCTTTFNIDTWWYIYHQPPVLVSTSVVFAEAPILECPSFKRDGKPGKRRQMLWIHIPCFFPWCLMRFNHIPWFLSQKIQVGPSSYSVTHKNFPFARTSFSCWFSNETWLPCRHMQPPCSPWRMWVT